MNLAMFCSQLTFDLILRLGVIFRLGIHPSVFSYIFRNTFSMDAKMYSKMPTQIFLALRIAYYSVVYAILIFALSCMDVLTANAQIIT